MSETANPMTMPRITKVVVNIGVGEGGDRLTNAEKVLKLVTGTEPVRTLGKQQNRDLKVRVGFPIGCKATMRNPEIIKKFLTDAFGSVRMLFLLGTLIELETFPLESQTTPISQIRNIIQTSAFLAWISISC